MGLLDKVKETAQKGADLAKEGVKAGQDKIDEQKLKKKVGDLKEELGGVVYAQKTRHHRRGRRPRGRDRAHRRRDQRGRGRAGRRRDRRRRRRRRRRGRR